MNFLEVKKIYFAGIGGMGVSALARLFLSHGGEVAGSDVSDFRGRADLESRGARIMLGHDAKNLPEGIEVLVHSAAVSENNPEIVEAKRRGIPVLSYADAAGLIMKGGWYGVAVSGTNGKTTTTAMLGKMLVAAGRDPLVIVGGIVPGWDSNLRLPEKRGKQDIAPASPIASLDGRIPPQGQETREGPPIFLIEGDEYRRHMLALDPRMIVLTNIEADHLDYYKDLGDIEMAFAEYVRKLGAGGILVYNADDPGTVKVSEEARPEVARVSYAMKAEADLTVRNVSYVGGSQEFELLWRGELLGLFSLRAPGRINLLNALAAASAALTLSVPPEDIRMALREWSGTWRRFQIMGKFGRQVVVSDYAHHPTAVRETIRAAKEAYPGKKILAVFQPHQKDRTRKFLKAFAESFREADSVILSEIYNVAGRDEKDDPVSSRDLAEAMKKDGENPPVGYEKNLFDTEKRVREIGETFDIILVMGAGDVHSIAENLVTAGRPA